MANAITSLAGGDFGAIWDSSSFSFSEENHFQPAKRSECQLIQVSISRESLLHLHYKLGAEKLVSFCSLLYSENPFSSALHPALLGIQLELLHRRIKRSRAEEPGSGAPPNRTSSCFSNSNCRPNYVKHHHISLIIKRQNFSLFFLVWTIFSFGPFYLVPLGHPTGLLGFYPHSLLA